MILIFHIVSELRAGSGNIYIFSNYKCLSNSRVRQVTACFVLSLKGHVTFAAISVPL